MSEVAVVTGAGRGIGAAIAAELASRGSRVVLAARTEGEVRAQAARVGGHAVVADVTVPEDVERLFQEARRLGPVTQLVNNAGTARPKEIASATLEDWRANLDANLTSAFLCSRAALQGMLPLGRGRIVNVASVSGVANITKFPGFAAYAAAKAGVIAFTEALAAEVGPAGVRVLCVSPGSVDTPLLRRVAPSVTPDLDAGEIARIVAWLLSEDAAAANGSNLIVRGRGLRP